jgi:hypothetical protein
MDVKEHKEEFGNFGSEHESVSHACETEEGNCEDTEGETDGWNGEQSKCDEAE